MNAQTTDSLSIRIRPVVSGSRGLELIRDGERPSFVVSSVSECLNDSNRLRREAYIVALICKSS